MAAFFSHLHQWSLEKKFEKKDGAQYWLILIRKIKPNIENYNDYVF